LLICREKRRTASAWFRAAGIACHPRCRSGQSADARSINSIVLATRGPSGIAPRVRAG
jgi:hypothetical protein